MKVIYGEEKTEKYEDLKANITNLIKETYYITEEDQINEIVCNVLKSLNLKK